ncbi:MULTISPECIES: hypothetical protein [Methylomonas]|uniref:Secreted protein n=1 Tax=Methylomonas koyamae TaxID=702114 RepID=A0A177P9C5_9GAMM|nr:hypothetical protein [Methylomonas koyamae]OAI26029.1 hypothetical protein A1355_19350 [Methylomonas koyamae]
MLKKLSIVAGFCWLHAPLQAATLGDLQSLPSAIQDCLDEADCSVADQSDFDLAGIAAFRYQAGTFDGYLLRYSLIAPSAAVDISDYPVLNLQEAAAQAQINESTPLAGTVWLKLASRYGAGGGNAALYFEHVTPVDKSVLMHLGDTTYPDVLNFQLNDQALAAGGAYRSVALNSEGSVEAGDLVADEPLLVCISEGCGTYQALHLVGVNYAWDGANWVLQFAADDMQRELYVENTTYNGQYGYSYHNRDYYVGSVPLPAAGGLCLVGLAWLGGLARRGAAAA